ncbi:hypothetical protein RIF29_19608 [Crotalaria pallida]|uniref:RRM domain-containing protein n=1 Tax=Crotalaria pallida TaxID=3830 RepID=A0AAN9F102_CROPI
MARKRKLPPNSTPSEQPPLKHSQIHQQQPQLDPEEEEYEEVEEEIAVEGEEDPDEGEEQDEEEQQQQNDAVQDKDNKQNATSSALAEDDDDPIQKLLEPFGKDQLVTLLTEAASKHRDVADRIRQKANADPSLRKIFVHGLGWDTTVETLAAAFRQYGEIEDCKAVTDKTTGKSKGYGFILFKTRGGARKALQQPQKRIGNRMTACQLASIGPVQQSQPNNNNPTQPNFNNSAASAGPAASEYTQRKIYVSNVGAELDPQRLLSFFARFGEIEEGPLGLDKLTGKPKGFCLFVYKRVEGAKRALQEPHKEFEGHVLHCSQAIDGPKPSKPQPQQQQQQQHQMMAPTAITTSSQFQRNANSSIVGVSSAPGHLMAPAGTTATGFNQGAAALPTQLNPALGQALTALLASQPAGLELSGVLGTLGSQPALNPGVPPTGLGVQGGYNSQANVHPGAIGGYGNQLALHGAYPNQQVGQVALQGAYPTQQVGQIGQVGLQGAYPTQQLGQGGTGRGQQQQYGAGQYGGVAPYMGH